MIRCTSCTGRAISAARSTGAAKEKAAKEKAAKEEAAEAKAAKEKSIQERRAALEEEEAKVAAWSAKWDAARAELPFQVSKIAELLNRKKTLAKLHV